MDMMESNMAGMHGHGKRKRYTHMTFFWGKNSEILFTMWPGTRAGHYALALIVCFLMAVLLEWIAFTRVTRPGWSRNAVGFTRVLVHTFHVGLANLVMLAVMSFNGGVFIVILFGHGVGYVLFGRPCRKAKVEDVAEGGDMKS